MHADRPITQKEEIKKMSKQQLTRAAECQAWMANNTVRKTNVMNNLGKSFINVDWIDLLQMGNTELGSRPLSKDGVSLVYNSILQNGVVNPKIVILIWEEDLMKSNIRWNEKTRCLQFTKASTSWKERPTVVKFYPIIGHHTTHAFLKHRLRKPNALGYKIVEVTYVVSSKKDNNISMAISVGRLNNVVGDNRTKLSCWDTLWSLHQLFKGVILSSTNKSQHKAGFQQARNDLSAETRVPATTMGSYSSVAVFTGTPVWDFIQRIFEGKADNDSFVKPTSLTSFKSMGDVPHDHLIRWMKKILNCDMKVPALKEKCDKYKKTIKIQKEITNLVNQLEDERFTTYKEVCVKFQCLDDVAWFKNIRSWSGTGTKEKLTACIKTSVKDKLQKFKADLLEQEEVYIYKYIFQNVV